MKEALPTIESPLWSCCEFLTSVREAFKANAKYSQVRMYFYGATQSGWAEIKDYAQAWLKAKRKRTIAAYIGTDHALTEPEALTAMDKDGVAVHLLTRYSGIFHPKLIVFAGDKSNLLLSGSNNLTRSGLTTNIEFATAVKIPTTSERFRKWESAIHNSSDILTNALLKDYEQQRNQRQKRLQDSDVPWQFTWRRRRKVSNRAGSAAQSKLPIELKRGALLYEVMPKETGPMGQQIQILKKIAIGYFGLPDRIGASVAIKLMNVSTGEERQLTMTYNTNSTMRLSIHEASFTERPCFLIFRQGDKNSFSFCVVSEALEPAHFQFLDSQLGVKRPGKRRTVII